MLDKDTKKIGVKINGVLEAHRPRTTENIFKESAEVKLCKANLEAAEAFHKQSKKDYILEAFRNEVAEFEKLVGKPPAEALMCYWDREYLIEAYEKWYKETNGVSCPTTFRVDGIKLRQGCNQIEGDITLQLFEDTENTP